MSLPAILRVAINAPLSRLFDYLPPVGDSPHPQESLLPGCRITVPFGRRQQTAVIVAHADKSEVPADKLRPAISPIDSAPVLSESDLWLVRFASSYYQHPIGEVVAAALAEQAARVGAHCATASHSIRSSGKSVLATMAPRSTSTH